MQNTRTMKTYFRSCPPKLFEIAMNFVADHIEAVEHFGGIPELIGEAIFNRVLERNASLLTPGVLTLFVNSYEQQVASSVSLRKCNLDAYVNSLIVVLPHLRQLDLSQCGIASDDETVRHLGNLQLPNLERLALQDNSLDDHCLRCLTMPATMFGRGPVNLTELYLAGNYCLTCRGLRHLKCFTKLKVLQFSLSPNTSTFESLATYFDMKAETEQLPVTIHTRGWAEPLFASSISNKTSTLQPDTPSTDQAKRFYGIRDVRKQPVTSLGRDRHQCVVFRKLDFRKEQVENLPPKKRMKLQPLEIDDNLMMSYLQCSASKPKKAISLWDVSN